MKRNGELEAKDIRIGDLETDGDEGKEIVAYIETWFAVDKKFCVDTASDDDTWLNMYARYDPFENTLCVECEISRTAGSSYFDYVPTRNETELIKDLIAQKLQILYEQSPREFCEEYYGKKEGMEEIV